MVAIFYVRNLQTPHHQRLKLIKQHSRKSRTTTTIKRDSLVQTMTYVMQSVAYWRKIVTTSWYHSKIALQKGTLMKYKSLFALLFSAGIKRFIGRLQVYTRGVKTSYGRLCPLENMEFWEGYLPFKYFHFSGKTVIFYHNTRKGYDVFKGFSPFFLWHQLLYFWSMYCYIYHNIHTHNTTGPIYLKFCGNLKMGII